MSHTFRISQSAVSRFYDPSTCEVYWVHCYVYGRDTRSTHSMKKGLLFEYELIGGCRGGTRPELPKSQQKGKRFGTPLKEETDLVELAAKSKVLMNEIGVELTEVQPHWVWEDMEAHLDAIGVFEGERCIIDVKYTECAESDHRIGWADMDNKPTIQPVHYVYLSKFITGEYLPFYYFIFGKEGWVKIVKETIFDTAIEEHVWDLEIFRENLKTFTPQPANNYNKCQSCEFNDVCKSKTTLPVVEQHNITQVIKGY